MRRKFYCWYSKLDDLDPDTQREKVAESLQEFLVKLDEIEEKVINVTVPPAYSDRLYALRIRIVVRVRPAKANHILNGI